MAKTKKKPLTQKQKAARRLNWLSVLLEFVYILFFLSAQTGSGYFFSTYYDESPIGATVGGVIAGALIFTFWLFTANLFSDGLKYRQQRKNAWTPEPCACRKLKVAELCGLLNLIAERRKADGEETSTKTDERN